MSESGRKRRCFDPPNARTRPITDGGWTSTTEHDEEAAEPVQPDGWYSPLYDRSHTAANPNVSARPIPVTGERERGWVATLPGAADQPIGWPLVTDEAVLLSTGERLVVLSADDGELVATVAFEGRPRACAYDPRTETLVAVSGRITATAPAEAGDAAAETGDTRESTSPDEPSGVSNENDVTAEPSQSDDRPTNEESSAQDAPPKRGGDEAFSAAVPVDTLREFDTVAPESRLEPETEWIEVCGYSLKTGESWRQLTELGAETRGRLLFPVVANERFYVPNGMVLRGGGGGRDTGEVGGIDPGTGALGDYVSYPYYEFNTTPSGTPAVDDAGEFYFHAGGQTGEVVRMGPRRSRPKWQSYIGDPGEKPWQPVVSAETMLAPGNGGEIVAIDRQNGDVRWTASGPAAMRDPTLRAVAHGGFYVVDGSRTVHCLAVDSGETVWTVDVSTIGDEQNPAGDDAPNAITSLVVGADTIFVGAGTACLALDCTTGEHRWSLEIGEPVRRLAVTHDALVVIGLETCVRLPLTEGDDASEYGDIEVGDRVDGRAAPSGGD
ncbi:PQQ-binding-like beta-propeller repeat protein [Natrialbaceae archaeon A-arb3/5]